MSEKSARNSEGWTFSVVVSLAKTCPLLDQEQALRAREVAYGERLPASLAWFDRTTSSWKTSARSLFVEWEPFSESWPRSGMMVGGTAYPLPPLAPLTAATAGLASSGWPTPRSAEFGGWQGSSSGKTYPTLSGAVGADHAKPLSRWPTPSASDWKVST